MGLEDIKSSTFKNLQKARTERAAAWTEYSLQSSFLQGDRVSPDVMGRDGLGFYNVQFMQMTQEGLELLPVEANSLRRELPGFGIQEEYIQCLDECIGRDRNGRWDHMPPCCTVFATIVTALSLGPGSL